MNEAQMDDVTQRLDRLERENRRWRLLGISAVTVLGLVVVMGATESKGVKGEEEIRARRIVVVDRDGKQRVVLDASGKESIIELRDENGKRRVVLRTDKREAWIRVRYQNGNAAAFLGAASDKSGGRSESHIFVKDGKGNAGVSLGAATNKSRFDSRLYLSDANGKKRVILNARNDKTLIGLKDADGNDLGSPHISIDPLYAALRRWCSALFQRGNPFRKGERR